MRKSLKSSVDLVEFTPASAARPVGFLQLMRYATKFDWFLLVFGTFCSITLGALCPTCIFAFLYLQDVLMRGQKDFESPEGLDMDDFSRQMVKWCCAFLLFGLGLFVFGYGATVCWIKLAERQAYRIKTHFLKRTLHQDAQFFHHNKVGQLTQKLSAGIDRFRDGTGDKLGFMIQSISNVIAGLVVGAIMDWRMACLMLAFMPVIICATCGQALSIKSSLKKETAASGEANGVADEVLSSIRTVAAFNAQEFEAKRYESHLDVAYGSGIRKALFTSVFTGCFELSFFAAMSCAVW
ncbi:ABC transmembrane type-1 domain-containing protein [Aphelenchoides fujianensis]|nr:ABC transmembrane type-1 domain-containing protein [Aphelenchoides fujianensis]